MKLWIKVIILTVLLAGAAVTAPGQEKSAAAPPAVGASRPYIYHVPAALSDGWKTASLESAGVDRRLIEAMTEEIRWHSRGALPSPIPGRPQACLAPSSETVAWYRWPWCRPAART